MRRVFVPFVLLLFVFLSCNQGGVSDAGNMGDGTENHSDKVNVIDCPADIAARAFCFAELYRDSDTTYEWGGQDPVRSVIGIDCSGLVIMCYKYALVDTQYSLLVSDMTAGYMYQNAATIVSCSSARKGDLIFMGEPDSSSVTHIALFDRLENGKIYFIDSTEKENISGVTARFYEASDSRFKAYGYMKLRSGGM